MVQDEGRVGCFGMCVCVCGWLVLCVNETAWETKGGMNNVSGFLVERLLVLMNN